MLVDTHCHLDRVEFEPDREAVLARARAARVGAVINPGVDLPSSRQACKLALEPGLYAAVGVHPHEAQRMHEESWTEIERLLEEHRPVAIGEVGLDYYKAYSPRHLQLRVLERFVYLAHQRGLPLIFHCRQAPLDPTGANVASKGLTGQAFEDLFLVVKPYTGQLHGVMHCFSGTRQEAETALELGFDLSFSGTVTFPSAQALRDVAKAIPLDRLVLETDAPYLAPQPVRGQRNEPAYLAHTAAAIAELRGMPMEAFAEATTANAKRLFRLP